MSGGVSVTEPQTGGGAGFARAGAGTFRSPELGRVLLYVLAFTMVLWVILPIYFITLGAFSTQDSVYAYPRELLPRHLSTDTLSFFLHSTASSAALERSVEVAVITLVFSLAIGIPAGYAIARFAFRGADAFRLTIVSTRAFPIVILAIPLSVTFIRWGIDDSVIGSRSRTPRSRCPSPCSRPRASSPASRRSTRRRR